VPIDLPNPQEYASGFRCIGSDCEDTCCQGWTVPIDRDAWNRYQSLPASPLRTLIDSSTILNPEEAGSHAFARIRMDTRNQCPLLTPERLCGIQTALGSGYLSHACATYPRLTHAADGWQEQALTMSCPEAARLVLLSPGLVTASDLLSEPQAAAAARALPADFLAIRAVVLTVVRSRLYPLWQRLFLLDLLCRRLDAIGCGDLKQPVSGFLRDFAATVATGALRTAMNSLPADPDAQLDMVLRLAGLMLHKSNVSPRFVECVHAFTAGIGNGPAATQQSLTAQYALACGGSYEPFMERHPAMMENYLINAIVRSQFPFGKDGMLAGTQPQMAREFALLGAQFALMRGLLIGVAGFHGPAFAAAHVVHTVQAASKHFEHHPEYLPRALALLTQSGMNGARGLAVLLRNAEPANRERDRASGEAMPASPAKSAPGPRDGRSAWTAAPDRVPAPVRSRLSHPG
jgi:lysine-N-methylase